MSEQLYAQAMRLHQAGRLQEAGLIYEQILRTTPRHFHALYSLGRLRLTSGQPDECQRLMGEALRIDPSVADAWCARGLVLMQLRRRDEALSCFDKALALKPNFLEALSAHATALLEMDRLDEAIAGFERILKLHPRHAISWNNRGNTFVAMRRLEEALDSFERALVLDPQLETARNNRDLVLLELKRSTRLPSDQVRTLFDNYANRYDAEMLRDLKYRAPVHLRALLTELRPETRAPLRILDLGCGTGLSGEAFKDLALGGRLDGIDLSEEMLARARARGCYDDLIPGDFESRLAAEGEPYDLIVAADSLNYHGQLTAIFTGVRRRLAPHGLVLFTVERKNGEGWEQTEANRFRHSEAYLNGEAARAGFAVERIARCELRTESDQPVTGLAVALAAIPSASPSSA